jgi:hypothetical protein
MADLSNPNIVISESLSTIKAEQPRVFDLLSFTLDGLDSTLNVNLSVAGIVVIVILILIIISKFCFKKLKGYGVEEITITDPFTNTQIKIKANIEDKKVAHKIWTELVTRKAALPFQRDKDVIIEVYDSWYALFKCVREQIAAIPVEKLSGREKTDIEALIDISMKVLNEGLRPHLTDWQAKYRVWYEENKIQKPSMSPQELQRTYPEYEQLVSSLECVNVKLKRFSEELKKIVRN